MHSIKMQKSCSYSSDSQQQKLKSNPLPELNSLGPDLIELILCRLQFPSILRATSVCKSWYSIIHSSSFKTRISNSSSLPWLFSCRQCYSIPKTYARVFCPESSKWTGLWSAGNPFTEAFIAKNALFFDISPGKFCFRPALSDTWHEIAPLKFSSSEHLIRVYSDPDSPKLTRLIAIGTSGGGDVPVNIYNPHSGLWEICPSPHTVSILHDISNKLGFVLFRNKFYLYGNGEDFLFWTFDLRSRSWSRIQNIRSHDIRYPYLFTCEDEFMLAGVCRVNNEHELNLWRIDETTLELTKIGVMPEELLSHFFGSEKERRYRSLECVSSGNVVYMVSRQRCSIRACVCVVSNSGYCSWRRIPDLPGSVSLGSSIVSFCCSVSMKDIL